MQAFKKKTPLKNVGILKKVVAFSNDCDLLRLAFDNSLQANIITTVRTGRIVQTNSAACSLTGYSDKELATKSMGGIFNLNEPAFKKMCRQRRAEGKSEAIVTLIKKNRKPLCCEMTSAIFMDEEGVEMAITTIVDLTGSILKQKKIDIKKEKIAAQNIELVKSNQKVNDTKNKRIVAHNIVIARSKQKLSDKKNKKIVADDIVIALAKSEARLAENNKLIVEYKKNFELIFNSSSEVIYDVDLVANVVVLSDAYEKEFGYKITGNMTPGEDWFMHFYPDDRDNILRDYNVKLASADVDWKYSFRFLRADDSVANVIGSSVILRDPHGKAYRIIGSMQDISKQVVLEERLEQEIKLKERQIAQASEEARETERSDIGKELHDNINQLLGVSKLYLDMAKRGGKDSDIYLNRSTEYTLTAIEDIRKLTKGLTTDTIRNLGLGAAITDMAHDMMEVSSLSISSTLNSFIETSVSDKFKINIFRILQEQLNNILKHAKATEVRINLSQNKNAIVLSISDNGIGFDTSSKRAGIGIDNMLSRARANNGKTAFVSEPGEGCILTVIFPVE